MGGSKEWTNDGKCAAPFLFNQVKPEKIHIERGKPFFLGQLEQVIQITPGDDQSGIPTHLRVYPSFSGADQPFFQFYIGLECFCRHLYEETASESFTWERSILIFSGIQYNRKMA
jgi:hypothetical protein